MNAPIGFVGVISNQSIGHYAVRLVFRPEKAFMRGSSPKEWMCEANPIFIRIRMNIIMCRPERIITLLWNSTTATDANFWIRRGYTDWSRKGTKDTRQYKAIGSSRSSGNRPGFYNTA